MSKGIDERDLDAALKSLFDRLPGLLSAEIVRTMFPHRGEMATAWSARAIVPRMGKSGQLLGRGSESLSSDGETPEAAVDKVVQFFQWRRQGLV